MMQGACRSSLSRNVMAAMLIVAIAVAPAVAGEDTLAIFNLRPTNIDAMGYSGDILFSVVSALEKEKQLDIMPRRKMEEMLFQAGLVQSDVPDQVIQAGKALNIRYILYGQVTKTASTIKADLHLMDVQRQQVAKTWNESYAGREAIAARVSGFARELVAAMQGGGTGETAVAEAAAAGPSVTGGPQLIAVNARGEGNKVVVTWRVDETAPHGGFHLYRASRPEGPFQFMGGTQEPGYVDDQVRQGMTYYYRVGVLASGGAELKNEMTAKINFTGERMPHPPLIMAVVGHVRRASIQLVPSLLNDQEHFDITGYKVYRRAADDKDWQPVKTVDAKRQSQSELALTVEDAGPLQDGAVYQFAVSSVDSKGLESNLSDPTSVTVLPKPTLALEKEGLLREIRIRWQPVNDITGYNIYRSDDNLSWERIDSNYGQAKVQHTDKDGLQDGRDYYYQVTAYDDKGESSPSNVVLARTKDLPMPPGRVTAVGGQVKSVSVAWDPVVDTDVGGYHIYRGTEPLRLERITTLRGSDKSGYLDKGSGFQNLEDGTDYYYAVESFNTHKALGGISPTVMATTKPRPGAVAGLSAAAAETEIVVSWQANPEADIASYVVYRSKDQGSWSKMETVPGSQLELKDADLRPEAQYRYRVIAVDADGLESDPSETDDIASPLAAPVKS